MQRKTARMTLPLMAAAIAGTGGANMRDAPLPSLDELKRNDQPHRRRASGGDTIPYAGIAGASAYRGEASPKGDRARFGRGAQKLARKARRRRKKIRGYFIG